MSISSSGVTGSARYGGQSSARSCYAQNGAQGVTPYQYSTNKYTASPSDQPCFRQIEVTLNSAQRVIINHPLVSQSDDGFAFDA